MVLCLVTLTDLYTRRAGLSASAELLVCMEIAPVYARSPEDPSKMSHYPTHQHLTLMVSPLLMSNSGRA